MVMYAQTIKREFIVWFMHSATIFVFFTDKIIGFWGGLEDLFFEKTLTKMPRNMLDKMWDRYKMIPIFKLLNIPAPTAPITNIGPEVVQKIDIFFASVVVISCFE